MSNRPPSRTPSAHLPAAPEPRLPYEATIMVRDSCLCLHAQRAARALARHFDAVLRPFGLTNGQFSLLMALNRPVPATMAPLAELLAMDRTTLTAALKPLQRRGLLEVHPDPADRRSRQVVLTPAGRSLMADALPVWTATHAGIDRLVGDPGRLRADLRALDRLHAGLPAAA
ncbi:MarR family winged helix-turn-helix transcriptional regulator [Ferrovibrio sp.]|uniref:MarR family winged helix-turn-helix transcriptional regulator n=1 Tax=Ferrovibrio sp. TaxID=1917215 RepID=UPI0035142A2F